MLFIIAVEFLSIQIKQNQNIKGLRLLKSESKILQYADDTTLTLGDQQSIRYTINELKDFSSVTGLNLNTHKTHGIWLGSLSDNPLLYEGLHFTGEPIKCLGIYIGKNKKLCHSKNWDLKINDLEISLLRWKKRNLTYMGKSTVLNTLIIPKLVYNMTVLHVPEEIIKRIEKLIYNFLWGKTHRIKKNTVIGPYLKGGLNVTDIESKIKSLKVSWLPRLMIQNKICGLLNLYFQLRSELEFTVKDEL